MRISLKIVVTIFTIFITSATYGYYTLNTNIGANFTQSVVIINIADLSCSEIGRTPSDLLHLTQLAIDQFWNDVPTSRLILQMGEVIAVNDAFRTAPICSSTTTSGSCNANSDLVVSKNILIACNENSTTFPDGSILGVTVPNNIQAKHIVGSLFLLNNTNTTHLKVKSDAELITILAHELGHAIGLGHASSPGELMYYKFSATQKRLGVDDIDGLTYLYGVNQPDILNCNSVKIEGPSNTDNLLSFLIGVFPTLFMIFIRKVKLL